MPILNFLVLWDILQSFCHKIGKACKRSTILVKKNEGTYFFPVGSLFGFNSPNLRLAKSVSIGAVLKLYGAEYITGIYIFRKYFVISSPR